jgi:CRP/FNR family transcriptional regulator, nitrogen oxide reductase regulator
VKPAPAFELPPGFKCRLLEDIPPADLQVILAAATRRRLKARQVLLNAGDPAESFFLLLSGRACIYTYTEAGQRVIFEHVGAGRILGGSSVLPRSNHYLMNTEIEEDGEALEWKRPVIRGLIHRFSSLTDSVLMFAADVVQESIARRLETMTQSAEQRVANALVEAAQKMGRQGADGVEVTVTNEQLSDTAGTSPFTVARILSGWARSGAIRRSRGKIEIRSLQKLADQVDAIS